LTIDQNLIFSYNLAINNNQKYMVERRPFGENNKSIVEKKEKPPVVVQYLDREGKTRLDLGPDRENLMLDIDEIITQFYRSKNKTPLKGDTGTETEYTANCRSATQDFGKMLAEQTDEDDQKFFERHPKSAYYDFENEKPAGGAFSNFNFHSIGFLEIPDPTNENHGYFLAIDLTYSASGNDKNTRTLVIHSAGKNSLIQEINKIYGSGPWTIYKLNPEKKTYVFEN